MQDEIARRKDLSREDRGQWTEALRIPLDEKLPTGTPEFMLGQEEDDEDDEPDRDSGRAERVLTQGTAVKIARALDKAADLIATRPPEAWDGWVAYLLEALDNKATVDDFHRVLEVLQADIAMRLVEGKW